MSDARISGHRIHYKIADGYAVVRPEGACNEAGTEALARLVNSSLVDSKHLILDLSHAQYVETPGFRWIVRQFKKLESDGRTMVVTGLPPSTERAFKLLKLDKMVPVARNMAEAFSKVKTGKLVAMLV